MPGDALRAAGHHVAFGRLGSHRLTGEFLVGPPDGNEMEGGLDVVILQRWMGAEMPDAIRRARSTGQVVINDVDDWFEGLPQSNRAFWTTHPRLHPNENRLHYRRTIAAGNAVICSTPVLADFYRRLGKPVFVIRNAIDIDRWMPVPDSVGEQITLGWMGATGYRDSGDFAVLRGVLGPWLDRNPGCRLHHAGSVGGPTEAARAFGVRPELVTSSPMSRLEDLPRLVSGYQVGLVPLADVPFNRAKSWLKGLEHAAAGIPIVATALPEYEALGVGILARRPADWVAAFDRLRDPLERRALAAEARRRAEGQDIRRRWTEWETTLMSVVGRRLVDA